MLIFWVRDYRPSRQLPEHQEIDFSTPQFTSFILSWQLNANRRSSYTRCHGILQFGETLIDTNTVAYYAELDYYTQETNSHSFAAPGGNISRISAMKLMLSRIVLTTHCIQRPDSHGTLRLWNGYDHATGLPFAPSGISGHIRSAHCRFADDWRGPSDSIQGINGPVLRGSLVFPRASCATPASYRRSWCAIELDPPMDTFLVFAG